MRKLLTVGMVLFFAVFCAVAWSLYSRRQVRREKPPVQGKPYLSYGAVFSEGDLPIEQWRVEQEARLADELPRAPKNVLVLSSGGARGAFGAGVLAGWSESGERPDFDVVTGVSVGSLLSVYAFLGTDYDALCSELFSQHATLTKFSVWADGSLFDDQLFRDAVEKFYDESVMQAVARRHKGGARLYVGTTNLDAQEFVIWDLGAIASSGRPDALKRFQDVLIASCTMPMLFPPAFFDIEAQGQTYDQMHVDGGVRRPLFLPQFVLSRAQKAADIYIIVNHSLESSATEQVLDDEVATIGVASFKAVLQDKLKLSLAQVKDDCLARGLKLKVVQMRPEWDQFSMRPEDAVLEPSKLFDEARRMIVDQPWSARPVSKETD